jgi:hypothetical protein
MLKKCQVTLVIAHVAHVALVIAHVAHAALVIARVTLVISQQLS